MKELIVLAFDGEGTAGKARDRLVELRKEEALTLEDACVVTRNQKGRTKIKQATNLVGAGALGGAFWGGLVGIFFLMPLAGMAIGAIVGAITGKFGDVGINDEFIEEVGQAVHPGGSALFLLIRSMNEERFLEAIKPFDPEIIRTNLTSEEEANLRRALGAEASEA